MRDNHWIHARVEGEIEVVDEVGGVGVVVGGGVVAVVGVG